MFSIGGSPLLASFRSGRPSELSGTTIRELTAFVSYS
jgi:hypothetical protein